MTMPVTKVKLTDKQKEIPELKVTVPTQYLQGAGS
jgi:hypothetical protein